jgi:hypothetical protein
VAAISIRKWTGSKWGPATQLANQTEAVGSINTSAIGASPIITPETPDGELSARTFGEAAISFDALFGADACGEFGSAYLKSRSSDSFTAALKDFVPPLQVDIGNCPAGLTTTATGPVDFGQPISDTAHLTGVSANAGGTITFNLYGPSDTPDCTGAAIFSSTVNVSGPNDYTSEEFTPTAAGSYYWTASYSGDANNDPAETACGDEGETSVVNQQPSTLATAPSLIPQDTATVGTDGESGTYEGTLTFELFDSLADCQTTDNDSLAVYSEDVTVPTDTTPGSTFSTNNSGDPNGTPAGYTINSGNEGSYFWQVTYDDATRSDATSNCVEESTVDITDDNPAGGTV